MFLYRLRVQRVRMKDLRIHSWTKVYAYSGVFRNNNDNSCSLISLQFYRENIYFYRLWCNVGSKDT